MWSISMDHVYEGSYKNEFFHDSLILLFSIVKARWYVKTMLSIYIRRPDIVSTLRVREVRSGHPHLTFSLCQELLEVSKQSLDLDILSFNF